MPTKIIIPILNKEVSTFQGPTWYLSENVSIETINAEDYFIISNSLEEEYKTLLDTRSKCVRIDNIDPKDALEISEIEASKVAFVLNYFKRSNPVALAFAVQITKKRKANLDRIIDLSVISEAYLQRNVKYKIKQNIKRELITQFYQVVSEVYTKKRSISLTLSRFNSALFRKELVDKIIDITISLESMISGTTELRYKFSLFNAWSADDDHDLRKKIMTYC